jgi:hypothetical protein
MQDLAATIIAVVSLVGTLLTIGVASWLGYLSDEHKRRHELKIFFAKYQDALLLAAQDLQSRLYNILDYNITHVYLEDEHKTENLVLYTAFAVGQYLSWVHIIRQRAQFLQWETQGAKTGPTSAIFDIAFEFSTDKYSTDNRATFMLWRGDQMAIGEIMTVSTDDGLVPMGYGAFHQRWAESRLITNDQVEADSARTPAQESDRRVETSSARTSAQESDRRVDSISPSQRVFTDTKGLTDFREWFRPIVKGVVDVAEAQKTVRDGGGEDFSSVPDQRMRRLQHRLVDLIKILDPKALRSEARFTTKAKKAAICCCKGCGA